MAEKKDDVNERPLTPKDKEPQTASDPKQQEGANRQHEQLVQAAVFGDNTSSAGEKNVSGQHGRDGGVSGRPEGGGPHNPVPDKEVMQPKPDKEEKK